jgi:hypothetical protein
MIVVKLPPQFKEMFQCAHAVEVRDSKKRQGQSLWRVVNSKWQAVWPKAIYAETELGAIIKCRGMIEEKLLQLAKTKQKLVDFKGSNEK